ncbi:hypothetical protein BKA93DRAFT_788791 [Sparassis latifolia]
MCDRGACYRGRGVLDTANEPLAVRDDRLSALGPRSVHVPPRRAPKYRSSDPGFPSICARSRCAVSASTSLYSPGQPNLPHPPTSQLLDAGHVYRARQGRESANAARGQDCSDAFVWLWSLECGARTAPSRLRLRG